MPSEPSTPKPRLPDLSSQQAAGIAVLFYVVGFVVSNAHYARYQVTRLDLLQTRYLSAALLFGLAIIAPFATAYILAAVIEPHRTRPDSPTRRTGIVDYALLFGVFFIVLGVTYVVAASYILIDEPGWGYIWISFSVPYLLGFVLFLMPKSVPQAPILRGIQAFYVAIFLIIGAFTFGKKGYPHVAPAFGGGAGWYSRIGFTSQGEDDIARTERALGSIGQQDSTSANILKEVLGRHVILVDRDAQSTTFMVCSRLRNIALPVTVPTETVRWQTTIKLVSLTNATKLLCAREPGRSP